METVIRPTSEAAMNVLGGGSRGRVGAAHGMKRF